MPRKKDQHKNQNQNRSQKVPEEVKPQKSKSIEHVENPAPTPQPYDFSRFKKETESIAELSKKYANREIHSNWSKYEAELVDSDGEQLEDDSNKLTDFNFLLNTTSTDCSHFQFSSEKNWEKRTSICEDNNIFNLDLQVLSYGLSCLPFHERMNLPTSEFSKAELENQNYFALSSYDKYKPIKEHHIAKQLALNRSLKIKPTEAVENVAVPSLQAKVVDKEADIEQTFSLRLENTDDPKSEQNLSLLLKEQRSRKPKPSFVKSPESGVKVETKNVQTVEIDIKNVTNVVKEPEVKIKEADNGILSGNENLEDWLDSVLDD